MKTFKQISLQEMPLVAKEILALFPTAKVFLLQGNLGAGKTTLTQNFCKLLNVIDTAASPTYSIVNEYKTAQGNSVFHLDLYRLKNVEETLNAGVEEVLFSGCYCFVEWFEIAEDLLPENCAIIEIEKAESDTRNIVVRSF